MSQCQKMDLDELKNALNSLGSELKQVRQEQKKIVENSTSGNDAKVDKDAKTSPPIETGQPEIAKLSQQIEELYIKFGLISEAIKKLDSSLDDLNQYGRRNCLVLHGLSANTDLPNSQSNYKGFLDKIIKNINDNLSLNLSSNNIDIAHPLPVTKNGKTPVIIKFLRRSDRNLVYQNKRHFSKSGLAITESLTKMRLQLLKEAGSLLGQENVWTSNETIFCNINAKWEVIKTQNDLYSLVENTYSNSAPSIELNNSNK